VKIAYFILNNFDCDSRARLEVETLLASGHDVEIIATEGADTLNFKGARIHRIPQWSAPTRKFRFLQYNFLAARIGKALSADVCHAVDLDTLYAAYVAAGKGRRLLVYEARELYTELEALAGRNLIKRVWAFLERRLIAKAQKIMTINQSLAAELMRRYGISRPEIVRNVAPLTKMQSPVNLREIFGIPADWKVLIYQGVLRPGQGLAYLIDMARYFEKIALIFAGDGIIKTLLTNKVVEFGLAQKVKFAGRIDPEMLPNFTAGADAGLLLMEDVALNNRLALPQKLFQYLAAGIPQIVSRMPEIASFVEAEGTGLIVPLDDPHRTACEIISFLSDGRRFDAARECCRRSAVRHNWELESAKLVKIYKALESNR